MAQHADLLQEQWSPSQALRIRSHMAPLRAAPPSVLPTTPLGPVSVAQTSHGAVDATRSSLGIQVGARCPVRGTTWDSCPRPAVHDLRHTAACLWLARSVDPVTVQAWMGHASMATTNLYLHYLESSADRAGLAL